MKNQGLWFEDGHNYDFRPATNRNIALGRNQFYVQFADFLFEKYRDRFYLLDYMSRLEGVNGQEGLIHYIDTAALIHINLEGVELNHLSRATVELGRLAHDKAEIGAPYTMAWEINYVFHRPLLDRVWFHTGSEPSRRQVYRAMGRRVPMERILDDNSHLLNDYWSENSEIEELHE